MRLDDVINKVSSNTMSQMLGNDGIAKNMSNPLLEKVRNIGFGLVVGVLALSSTGMAHADARAKIFNTTIGIGALAGIAKSGEVPEGIPLDCATNGKSGLAITAGTIGGALIGKAIGKGSGNKAAIIAGGILGGTGVNAIQDRAIREECFRQNQSYQDMVRETSRGSARIKKVSSKEVYANTPSAQFNRHGDFAIADSISGNPIEANAPVAAAAPTVFRNAKGEVYQSGSSPAPAVRQPVQNQNFGDGDYPVQPAVYNQPAQAPQVERTVDVRYPTAIVANVPQDTVLYAFEDRRSRRVTYVTAKDSPGLSSMLGAVGQIDVTQAPEIEKQLNGLNNNLVRSYQNLTRASSDYLNATGGVKLDQKPSRAANYGSSYDNRLNRQNRQYIQDMVKNVQSAQKDFSEARGEFMQVADVYALEGYSLKKYGDIIQLLDDGPIMDTLYHKKNVNQFTKFKR